MHPLRCRRPATAWIAILALLAMAMLPTFTQAVTHLRGDSTNWVEVCTPQGMRLVSLNGMAGGEDAPTEQAPLQAAAHLEHCALCTLLQPLPALPAADVPSLVPALAAHALPWLFLHAPHKLHAWRSTQPRGPPHHLP